MTIGSNLRFIYIFAGSGLLCGARCLPDGRHRSIEATAQTDSFPIPICCSEIFCLFFLLRKEATSYSDKKGSEKFNIEIGISYIGLILHNDSGSPVSNRSFDQNS